jgi:hypothetical protein
MTILSPLGEIRKGVWLSGGTNKGEIRKGVFKPKINTNVLP